MGNQESKEITMLAELVDCAAAGKNVKVTARPVRNSVKLEREGEDVETIILSMEYIGTVDEKPFALKKEYSHTYDVTEYCLDCLIIANNRLQMDYDRLEDGGIDVRKEFFTFQNTFLGLPGLASAKTPALRLETFINLARAGISVSVVVTLKHREIFVKEEDVEKSGFVYVADFVFTTEEGTTTIEKLYTQGAYDDSEERKERIIEVTSKRLGRDFERLRRVGIKVESRAC
jgi:hypothetical protein